MQKILPDQIVVFWGKSKGMKSLSQIIVNVLFPTKRKYSLASSGYVPSSISSRFLRTHCVGSLHLSASEACRLAFSRIFLSLLREYSGFCCCQNSVRVSRYSSPWIARVRIALFVTDWLLADSSHNSSLPFIQSFVYFSAYVFILLFVQFINFSFIYTSIHWTNLFFQYFYTASLYLFIKMEQLVKIHNCHGNGCLETGDHKLKWQLVI